MECLAPPLLLTESVIAGLENGVSVRGGIKTYLQNTDESEFSRQVGLWLFSVEQGLEPEKLLQSIASPYRRAVLSVLAMGIKGQPILDRLQELRGDIITACENEVSAFISLLPLKLLIPIMIFMFPAFLILLLGPLITTFLSLL